MQQAFTGTVDDLKKAVAASGLDGHWVDEGEFFEFHADDGPALNFWPEKKIIMLQGAPARAKKFEERLRPYLNA